MSASAWDVFMAAVRRRIEEHNAKAPLRQRAGFTVRPGSIWVTRKDPWGTTSLTFVQREGGFEVRLEDCSHVPLAEEALGRNADAVATSLTRAFLVNLTTRRPMGVPGEEPTAEVAARVKARAVES